jgi:hypothetical protein
MSKFKPLTLFCVPAFALIVCAATPPGNVELPPGPMQGKARTGCTTCHDAHIVVQQRLSKAAWGKEVDKMVKWGAIVNTSDRDALVDYFSANFPPDKPAYVARRSAPARH